MYLRTWNDMKRDAKRGIGPGVLGGNGSIGMRLGLVMGGGVPRSALGALISPEGILSLHYHGKREVKAHGRTASLIA